MDVEKICTSLFVGGWFKTAVIFTGYYVYPRRINDFLVSLHPVVLYINFFIDAEVMQTTLSIHD